MLILEISLPGSILSTQIKKIIKRERRPSKTENKNSYANSQLLKNKVKNGYAMNLTATLKKKEK